VLSTPDPQALASFYEAMLGWTRIADEPTWVKLRNPYGRQALSFHLDERYERPAWPSQDGRPHITMHLDIAVPRLEEAVEWAVICGAAEAAHQPQRDVRVMLDPHGHPFCLFTYATEITAAER
jgi:hypothetical protein